MLARDRADTTLTLHASESNSILGISFTATTDLFGAEIDFKKPNTHKGCKGGSKNTSLSVCA